MNLTCLTTRNSNIFRAVKDFSLYKPWAIYDTKKQDVFDYGPHVLEAKKNGLPIVALESTIITHGMPYPQNIETALLVEDTIRKNGAVPATIAILQGKIHVGVSEAEIQVLAETPRENVIKCSRRDFPFVISHKLNGSTTVCGTMFVSQQAGIQVMATGGIGGVHRGAESNIDISADLKELSRTSIAVVCAGVKSIADIPKTLEFLETEGVPVIKIGETHEFPAFYTRETFDKLKAPMRVSNSKEAADLIRVQRKLNIISGMIFAVPIPESHALIPEEIERAIQESLKQAKLNNIVGKAITPFLLQEIARITAGRSIQANIALVANNAKIAAEIAKNLNTDDDFHISSPSLKKKPVVIGGAVFDTTLQVEEHQITTYFTPRNSWSD